MKNPLQILSDKIAGGRVPPQALDMEQAVLGALMLSKDAIDFLPPSLKGECFYKDAHRYIFDVVVDLAHRREPVDLLSVKNELVKAGQLDMAGGILYLTELTSKVAAATNVEYHARVIVQKYMLRELIKLGDKMSQDGYNPSTDPFEALTEFRSKLDEIEPSMETGASLSDAVEQSEGDIERAMKGDYTSIKPGYANMEGVMFEPGEVIVVGGDTGMGKTAWGFGFAMGLSRNKIPVFYNSLEMKPKELAKRTMASYAAKKIWHIRTGKMEMQDWDAWQHLKNHKRFEIRACRTTDQLFASIRTFRKRFGMRDEDPVLVVNDYLQLMGGQGDNRESIYSTISHEMKQYAMNENALVINLSQMNRSSLNSDKKKPTKDGLKYAGSIEQDADYIYLLYRPEYYGITEFEDGTSTAGRGELIEAKMRNGFTRPYNDQLKFAFAHGLWLPEDEAPRLFGTPNMPLFQEAYQPPAIKPRNPFADDDDDIKDFRL